MPLILAIEGDPKQAALVKCVVRNHVGATLVVVQSKDEAIAAIDAEAPDLILLSALLSPREEENLVAHLRTRDRADHLQTLTIPRIAAAREDETPRGLLAAFRRRRSAKTPAGCDPRRFADEIVQYLQRAEDIKAERVARDEAALFTAQRAEQAERFTSEIAETGLAPTAEITESPETHVTTAGENPRAWTTETAGAAESVTTEFAENAEKTGVIASVASAVNPSVSSASSAVTTAGSECAATPRRQAPLAMWAKAEIGDVSRRGPREETIRDEIGALLRSLRIPAHLTDVGTPHGCRIRHVRVARARVRERSVPVGA